MRANPLMLKRLERRKSSLRIKNDQTLDEVSRTGRNEGPGGSVEVWLAAFNEFDEVLHAVELTIENKRVGSH